MPSSHSAIATALALAIGLQDGLGGPPFATALVTAFVVIRDGISARSQAQPEEQAESQEVVNQTESELPTEPLLAQSTPQQAFQQAFLGRPWLEVVFGGLLGLLTAAMIDLTTDLPVYQYCRPDMNRTTDGNQTIPQHFQM
nr:putative membrane protein YuiD [Ipomoea batatas]GME07683.1 putative membrane protein YuiD [Ipomoea batatas]GME07684.1 putative membrane protein YuiD [Ipomoea batatas]